MSSKRWKTIEENVKLMLFRDRKYTPLPSEKKEKEGTSSSSSSRKKRKNNDEKQNEHTVKQFMAKYSITFPTDWPDEKEKKMMMTTKDTEDTEKKKTTTKTMRIVRILFLNELDMTQWEVIYNESRKNSHDLIVVSLHIQPAVHHVLERLSFDKENSLRVECFEGSSLMNDLLSHRMNLQNRPTLLSPIESREIHKKVFNDAELPVLKTNDVVAAWLGARPHQLVQYDRVSRGVGMSRAYRVVQ